MDSIRTQLEQRLDKTNERLDQLSADLVNRMDGNNQRLDRLTQGFSSREEHLWLERRLTAVESDLAELKRKVA